MKVEKIEKSSYLDIPVWLLHLDNGIVYMQRTGLRSGTDYPIETHEEIICALCDLTYIQEDQSE